MPNKLSVSVSLSKDTLEKVDEARGLIPRSTFFEKVVTESLSGRVGPEVVKSGSVEIQKSNGETVAMGYKVHDIPAKVIEMPTVQDNPAMGVTRSIGTPNNNSVIVKPDMSRRS